MDDALEEKDKRSITIAKGGKKRNKVGFSFVTAVVIVGYVHLPLIGRLAFREAECKRWRLNYKSKVQIAMEMIRETYPILKGERVYILLDSWYPSGDMLKMIKELNYHVIAAIKSNRKVNGKQIQVYKNGLRKSEMEKMEAGAHRYYLSLQTGTLNRLKMEYRILLSCRLKKRTDDETWRYILCSDFTLSCKDILKWYQKRWVVETFHQIWKHRFGMVHWQLSGVIRLRNLVIVTIMTMGFAVHYALKHLTEQEKLELQKNGQSIMGVGLMMVRSELILQNRGLEKLFDKFVS